MPAPHDNDGYDAVGFVRDATPWSARTAALTSAAFRGRG